MFRKRLKSVNQLQSEAHHEHEYSDHEDELLHINTTETVDDKESNNGSYLGDKWLVQLKVHEKQLKFRIDTGAKCNISEIRI